MSLYVFFNWLFCIITAVLLIVIFLRYRFLFIKPSFMFLTFFHIQIQWAATIQSAYIENFLMYPYSFFILAQIFPLLGLVVSFFVLHKKTKQVYSRIYGLDIFSFRLKEKNLLILFLMILIIVIFYFLKVPLSHTGLYAIFLDPLNSAFARESSLKLLDSWILRYSFSFLKSVLAPLLSILITIYFFQNLKKINILKSLISIFVFFFILIAVSIPGARMPFAMLILAVFLAFYFKKGMPVRPVYIIFVFVLILIFPILMTIFREGKEFNLSLIGVYLKGGIFKRVFVVPMQTGLWHVHYAQEMGFLGVTGIQKLAMLFGVEPMNISNIIYWKYTTYSVYSGLSNTCFAFLYYSCFGLVSIIFSFLGLWALDFSILVFAKIKDRAILLAVIASIASSAFYFVSTSYTIALITNGFVILLIVSLILDKFSKNTIVKENKTKEFNNEN